MYKKMIKRPLDTMLALMGTVVLGPLMLIVSVLIKIDSKGPILYKQERLGKNRKPFTIYKFRTMCENAYEMGGVVTESSDKRITKIGSILRRTSIDELPQFFNIINGTMAIIGPRPILDWEFEQYCEIREYKKRYDVLPGMFCTVDLNYRASAERELQFKMDAKYSENITFIGDCKIFFGIIKTVVTGKNIYRKEDNTND